MKFISFAIPCYNSEAYMEKAIQSILKGGEDVEIIIVDDGSTKDRYSGNRQMNMSRFDIRPSARAVHQENGGHGQAVNTGLKPMPQVDFL